MMARAKRAMDILLQHGHQGMASGVPVPPPEHGGPTSARPIHMLSQHLRRTQGRKLRRLMLDLGLDCPNRDGTSGYGGCIYCDVHGSGTGAMRAGRSLEEQFAAELRRVRRSIPEGPCGILYFQSYSNTWPDLQPLARALEWAVGQAEVAPILAIGTRPDCFSEEAADLIARHAGAFRETWMEFGLETADDEVQQRIGRHDTLANFHLACRRAGERGLQRVAHTIAGLPGERPDGLLRQVEEIARAGCEGIKFHQLIVLRRTILAKQWLNGEIELPSAEEYAAMVAAALRVLPWSVVVHRLCADAPPAERLDGRGPAWNRSAERKMLDALGEW
jgi:radical SAM protein (TIGR01212 family)